VIADYASGLEPLGNPKSFEESVSGLRGGFSERIYRIVFEGKTLTLITRADSARKREQYQIVCPNKPDRSGVPLQAPRFNGTM